nr:MAG TPA: hypothetical protein [Caudoviricetes sp.]
MPCVDCFPAFRTSDKPVRCGNATTPYTNMVVFIPVVAFQQFLVLLLPLFFCGHLLTSLLNLSKIWRAASITIAHSTHLPCLARAIVVPANIASDILAACKESMFSSSSTRQLPLPGSIAVVSIFPFLLWLRAVHLVCNAFKNDASCIKGTLFTLSIEPAYDFDKCTNGHYSSINFFKTSHLNADCIALRVCLDNDFSHLFAPLYHLLGENHTPQKYHSEPCLQIRKHSRRRASVASHPL